MHRVLLREVIVDVPSEKSDATRRFWAGALGGTVRPLTEFPEFAALENPAALPHLGFQDIGNDAARFHLDIETDDIEAEVARLAALGAVVEQRRDHWVVMRDPAGLLFCLLPPESDEFAERSRVVD
ncbi:MAG: VOC family protein [Jatrophihabitans sp.]|uniref:VOC family protein n=1 Tax=Jatrophihabitans sp. TaxID=1932789 RepID=UPI003912D2D5